MVKQERHHDLIRLEVMVSACESIQGIIVNMENEEEYKRARTYIDSRFGISLPYTPDRFKEVAKP